MIKYTMGIGDWGLGIGDWGLGPIPNPQSPIPNPQSPFFLILFNYLMIKKSLNFMKINIYLLVNLFLLKFYL